VLLVRVGLERGAAVAGATFVLHVPAAPTPLPPPLMLLPAPPLAPPPRDCPAPPTLSTVDVPFFGRAIGRAPLYIVGVRGQPLTVHLGGPDGMAYTQYGWVAQIEWALMPEYAGRVTVSADYLVDGSRALMTESQWQAPSTSVVLDPLPANGVPMAPHWNEWIGTLFLPGAGCATLHAQWFGGAWTIPFAAGR